MEKGKIGSIAKRDTNVGIIGLTSGGSVKTMMSGGEVGLKRLAAVVCFLDVFPPGSIVGGV